MEQRQKISAIEKSETKNIQLPERFQLHNVPHNPMRQKGTDCAPDSLRMVLNYRGKDISKDWDIPMQLSGFRGRSGGTTLRQMQEIAVNFYELPSFLIHNCDLDSMKAAIINEWPPVIGYRSRGNLYHAVVVVGYNNRRNHVLVNDPNYLGIKQIRYYDLGGISKDSVQRFESLFVLPEGSTIDTFKDGLRKYVPEKTVSKLRIFTMIPSDK